MNRINARVLKDSPMPLVTVTAAVAFTCLVVLALPLRVAGGRVETSASAAAFAKVELVTLSEPAEIVALGNVRTSWQLGRSAPETLPLESSLELSNPIRTVYLDDAASNVRDLDSPRREHISGGSLIPPSMRANEAVPIGMDDGSVKVEAGKYFSRDDMLQFNDDIIK